MPTKASPIPSGFHSLTPHLVIRGAARAMDWYKQVFGARERSRMPGPDGQTLLHAELQVGDSILMVCDEFPDMGCRSPLALGGTSVALHLYVPNADQVFDMAVRNGAESVMPMADMFWGDRYGKVRDPFGHEWSIATRQYDLTPEEMGRAAEAAMAEMCGQK